MTTTNRTTLDEVLTRPRGLAGLVDRLARGRGVSRRGVLVGAAVAGSALATDPKAYALRPQSAYATICGPSNTAAGGWTIFCATINKGVNGCPPGSFTAGWWKAADSSWCGGGYRYIVDCNAKCTRCTSGCSDHICDSKCWNCSCGAGSKATCDQRRVCCNDFRYGQCNTQVKCSGGVHCRVVSCVPPYRWDNCSTTSLRSDATAEHSSPYLPQWGPMEQLYTAMGGQRSYLKASTSPIKNTIDGRAKYVNYQGGRIWWTSATGAAAMTSFVLSKYAEYGGPDVIGFPTGPRLEGLRDGGWVQRFQNGAIVDSTVTATQCVWGWRWTMWNQSGRENGPLRWPVALVENFPAGGWIQRFQKGAIVSGITTPRALVHNWAWTAWLELGREGGVLGFPTGDRQDIARGTTQGFEHGGLWSLAGAPCYGVWGPVLEQWQAAGGPAGRYGFPLAHVADNGDGTSTGRFEGGNITA
ncbi:LGFP repeat-containing protein [Phycicoccus sonneratiae]|uniref:LGFP repeat-containing protein n=1 Tax=Phycicoccus sonneratiae TaxID=2807628 RepID=A0ABS2CM92_9MICO|nr:hypothetical protein [Phycicoccus sonneraticus]MBM6400999.1 hypothetical protein [Phycicoccus sonneraticus]